MGVRSLIRPLKMHDLIFSDCTKTVGYIVAVGDAKTNGLEGIVFGHLDIGKL